MSMDMPTDGRAMAFSHFLQNFSWLLFGWTLRMYLPNLKFVALSVPEIIGCSQKIGQSLYIRPRSIFSQIFNWLLFARTL